MVTSTEDIGRTKGNKPAASQKITLNARGQTCVDAKQYQSRSESSIVIKVIDRDVCYFLTYLTYLKMVKNYSMNKCCVRVLNITQLIALMYNKIKCDTIFDFGI